MIFYIKLTLIIYNELHSCMKCIILIKRILIFNRIIILYFSSISYLVLTVEVVHRYDGHEYRDDGDVREEGADGSLGPWAG